MKHIASTLTFLSGLFFPLFFVPLQSSSSSTIEMNAIAAILLIFVSLIQYKTWANNKYILYGVLAPWALMSFGYLISTTAFVTPRASVFAFLYQLVFLFAAVGLAAQMRVWYMSRPTNISWYLLLIVGSYFIGFYLKAPSENFFGLWQAFFEIDVREVIKNARRGFNPEVFTGRQSIEKLANNHNRIAQQTFSLGFFTLTLALLTFRRSLITITVTFFSIIMITLSVFLLSGQSLGQLLITVALGGFFHFMLRPTYGKFILYACLPLLAFGIFFALRSTSLATHWFERALSGNFDTGRVDRWARYVSDQGNWLIIGRPDSLDIDPHNLFVSIFFDVGVIPFVGLAIFVFVLLVKSLSKVRVGYQNIGFAYLMMATVGVQMVFVMLLAGGYGFPGWAEMSKFSLFLLAMMLASSTRVSPRLDHRRAPYT